MRLTRTSRGMSTAVHSSFYEEDQLSLQKTVRKIIDDDINPYVDQWEADGQYPAHEVFKKLGQAGLLGINKVRLIWVKCHP